MEREGTEESSARGFVLGKRQIVVCHLGASGADFT